MITTSHMKRFPTVQSIIFLHPNNKLNKYLLFCNKYLYICNNKTVDT